MPLAVDGILFDTLSADPGSPAEGQVWYNTTDKLFKAYRNGATTSFTDATTFTNHTSNTSNPHTVTLEQARTAGSTLSGSINMGANAINNLGAGSTGTDAAQRQWVVDQINQRLAGLDWQESVLNRLSTPPGSPVTGDRYLIVATASGAWAGQEDKITQWSGSAWDFYTPNEGWVTRVEAENLVYTFDGTSWGNIGGAVSHSALTNLTADDHLQYLPRSGSRAMTGGLDMGGQSITNVNLVDGVDVSTHASRHNPGGGDALATAAPTQGIGGGNSQGTAASLARSDHDHTIRETAGPTNLTVGSITAGQYLRRVGTEIVGAAISGGLLMKAGKVVAGSFAGNPKKATVTFSAAFSDANYAVTLTPIITGNRYIPNVESQVAGSFVINMGANAIPDLTSCSWIAVQTGESS